MLVFCTLNNLNSYYIMKRAVWLRQWSRARPLRCITHTYVCNVCNMYVCRSSSHIKVASKRARRNKRARQCEAKSASQFSESATHWTDAFLFVSNAQGTLSIPCRQRDESWLCCVLNRARSRSHLILQSNNKTIFGFGLFDFHIRRHFLGHHHIGAVFISVIAVVVILCWWKRRKVDNLYRQVVCGCLQRLQRGTVFFLFYCIGQTSVDYIEITEWVLSIRRGCGNCVLLHWNFSSISIVNC